MKLPLILALSTMVVNAQDFRWQQQVQYNMSVSLDVKTHKLAGTQKLVYSNHSPDTLRKVFYHLYFNAFQPGSMMDVRSRTISDPDRRIGDRISKLGPDEIGFQKILDLKQDGKPVKTTLTGTILEVELATPLLPKGKTTFDMTFEAQVPIQVRRSGRNNAEGISYSMTQWYPKLAEYDHQGWHADQYVAREFHGVWGDFDVRITIDPTFTIASTGILQDPDKIGHGYETPGKTVPTTTGPLTWHFVARNVIDFAWAADPDYVHDRLKVPGGPELHFFYQGESANVWKSMEPIAQNVFEFLNHTFGKYPFESYSVIQGGDGGMEYPMCTLILGKGRLEGVAGTMAHEVAHSWYQMALASNESLYAWMDEGFTDFASDEAIAFVTQTANDHSATYKSYFSMVSAGLVEPASLHADHFATNKGYRNGSYTAGAIFLHQLKYIIGTDAFYKGMMTYYNTWKFKHPEPNDFIRVMEKVSGMQLHWYERYWIQTTRKIDYGIQSLKNNDNTLSVTLQRVGDFPMPIELVLTFKDGHKELVYVPTNETLGSKIPEDALLRTIAMEPWPWVNPTYTLTLPYKADDILSMEIDPSLRMADISRSNNRVIVAEKLE